MPLERSDATWERLGRESDLHSTAVAAAGGPLSSKSSDHSPRATIGIGLGKVASGTTRTLAQGSSGKYAGDWKRRTARHQKVRPNRLRVSQIVVGFHQTVEQPTRTLLIFESSLLPFIAAKTTAGGPRPSRSLAERTRKTDPVKVIFLKDLFELLEKVTDRCRDAGNVINHIVLKNS